MIDQYDFLQQSVKQHEAVLKGKAKSTQKLSALGMKVILQKNKQIKHMKKQHLSKVIQARKLKIKVSQIFNIKLSFANSYAAQSQSKKKDNNVKSLKKLMIQTAKPHHATRNSLKMNGFLSGKISQKSTFRTFSQKTLPARNFEEDDGRINLFDNFTEQQLFQIQQDEIYYLVKADLISVFRKYMLRKRQNNKDYSYEKFTIKPHHSMYYKFSEDMNFDKKLYILNTLKIDSRAKIQTNETHLLTSPIEFTTRSAEKQRSKSLFQLRRESKLSLYNTLRQKQALNKQNLIVQQNKKILDLRINRNYFDGLAAEKRAIYKDKLHGLIVEKNKYHNQKSLACRQRIKTLREDLGKSVELAETIRSEILKRRTANKKKS